MISKSTWIMIAAVVAACCVGYALFESDNADAAVSFSDGTLNYESISDSEAKVTGFTNDTVSVLTIPASYRHNGVDYAITEIGASAFDAKLITRVNLGNVEKIDAEAFTGCVALTTVAGTELNSIGAGAFAGCVLLNSISLSNVTTVGASAFMGCTMLTSVMMPKMITIGAYAFYGSGLTSVVIYGLTLNIGAAAFNHCPHLAIMEVQGLRYTMKGGMLFDRLTGSAVVVNQNFVVNNPNFVIPSDVKKISDNAFDGCDELVTITIPDTVTDVGDRAFVNCPNLRSVIVTGGTSYKSVDGCLYSYDGTTICFVPETFAGDHGTFVVPEGVATVGSYAFTDCVNLTEIDASNVTEVKTYAFSDCKNLTHMRLNSSAKFGIMSMDLGSLGNTVNVAVYADNAGFLNITHLNAFTTVTYMLPVTFELEGAPSSVVVPSPFYAQNGSILNLSDLTKDFPAEKTWNTYVNDVKCETSTYTMDGAAANIRFEFTIDYPFNAYVDGQEYKVTGPGKASIVNPLDGKVIPASITCDGVEYDVVSVIIDMDVIMSYSRTAKYVVDPSNKYLMADESGVLYDKDQTVLYKFPSESTLSNYAMPDTVKVIGAYAFSNCNYPTTLGISTNLETVKEYAFEKCKITYYVFPESLKCIEDNAFSFVLSNFTVCFKTLSMDGVEFTPMAFLSVGFGMTKPYANLYTYDKEFTIDTSDTHLKYNIMPSVVGDTFTDRYSNMYELISDGSVAATRIDNRYGELEFSTAQFGCDTYDITVIRAGAAIENSTTTKLTLGSQIKTIESGALAGFKTLTSIVVEDGCGACSVSDGMLLSTDDNTLLKVVVKKNGDQVVVIPDTVTAIEAGAIKGLVKLVSISFPAGLVTLGEGNLEGLTFADVEGNPLAITVANLSGATFKSSDNVNFVIDDGKIVVTIQAENGTVSQSAVRVELGSFYTVDGESVYFGKIHITVSSDEGYFFDKWTVNGEVAAGYGTVAEGMVFKTVCVAGCTVTFVAGEGGAVNIDEVFVPCGTAFTVDNRSISFRVGNTVNDVIATPNKEEHYLITFKQWSVNDVILASGTFDKDMTIRAEFIRQEAFAITFEADENGDVNRGSLIVPSGTAFTVNGSTISFRVGDDSYTVSATPKEKEHYEVSFKQWTVNGLKLESGTFDRDMTIGAEFSCMLEHFTVTLKVSNSDLGSITTKETRDVYSIELPLEYGTVTSIDGNRISFGTEDYGIANAKESKDSDLKYVFVGFTGVKAVDLITCDLTITAEFNVEIINVPVEDGAAIIDMSENIVSFDESSLATIKSDADTLVAKTSVATITFDKVAISKIDAATLSVESLVADEYPEVVKDALGVIEIDFGSNHDFSGGKLTIVIPLEVDGKVKIGYVNGLTVEDIPATYDAENKLVSFEVDHLSTFAVLKVADESSGSGNGSMTIIIAVVVIAIIAAVRVFLVMTGRIPLSKKN